MVILALKKGDRVVKKIIEYIDKNEIKSGLIIGLGALSEATLMIYDLASKEYSTKEFCETLEVGSFTAVIAKDPEGKAHIHPHAVVSDRKFSTFCGHLKEATVGATLELVILDSKQEVNRYVDSSIGLNLIK